jgi:hypothetical protein
MAARSAAELEASLREILRGGLEMWREGTEARARLHK